MSVTRGPGQRWASEERRPPESTREEGEASPPCPLHHFLRDPRLLTARRLMASALLRRLPCATGSNWRRVQHVLVSACRPPVSSQNVLRRVPQHARRPPLSATLCHWPPTPSTAAMPDPSSGPDKRWPCPKRPLLVSRQVVSTLPSWAVDFHHHQRDPRPCRPRDAPGRRSSTALWIVAYATNQASLLADRALSQ